MVAVLDEREGAKGRDPKADAEAIASELRGWSDEQWLELQTAAGIQLHKPPHRRKAPSFETQNLVIDRYYARVDVSGETDQ